ncbi:uncharacterized protein LW93_12370 [Fusarium fujikuroi]|nr:uncharacterized protein LW93_12370 [Fusarium fujikuroi]
MWHHVTRAQHMNRVLFKPDPNFLSNRELLSLAHFGPSKDCLDKLDKMDADKFSECFHRDWAFNRFMYCVVRVRSGTPDMMAYWLMKNWAAEVREEVYGEPKTDIMDLTTEDMRELSTGNVTGTILAKLEVMNNGDFSVYMTDKNFNKFVNEVVGLRPGFPPHLRMDVVKLRVRLIADGTLTV